MITRAAFGLAWLLSAPAAAAAGELPLYANQRYGFQVAYPPALLSAQPESENGDGRQFESPSGDARLVVYGFHRLDELPDRDCDAALRIGERPGTRLTYQLKRATFTAASGFVGEDAVTYVKTLRRSGQCVVMQLDYPVAARARFDPLVAPIAASLAWSPAGKAGRKGTP